MHAKHSNFLCDNLLCAQNYNYIDINTGIFIRRTLPTLPPSRTFFFSFFLSLFRKYFIPSCKIKYILASSYLEKKTNGVITELSSGRRVFCTKNLTVLEIIRHTVSSKSFVRVHSRWKKKKKRKKRKEQLCGMVTHGSNTGKYLETGLARVKLVLSSSIGLPEAV